MSCLTKITKNLYRICAQNNVILYVTKNNLVLYNYNLRNLNELINNRNRIKKKSQ